MRLTLVWLVIVVLVAACSPGDEGADVSSSTTAPQGTTSTEAVSTFAPVSGETAVVGVLELPETLNPIAAGGTRQASRLVYQATLPGAFVYEPETWRAVPGLVVRIPSVDEGDVTVIGTKQLVTWTIDPDATWSDGVPVSGADFAFTLRAAFGDVECAEGVGSLSPFGFGIEDVGAKTITVEMFGPSALYETMFGVVVPAHATDEQSICTDDGVGWPSAGPFLSRALDEDRIQLVRNETYWREPAAFAAVEFVRLEDESEIVSAVANGVVDVAVVTSPEVAAEAIDEDIEVLTAASGRMEHLAFDFRSGEDGAEALLGVLQFRQGVARAIDREAIASEIGWVPVTGVARTAVPPAPWDPYGYDPDESRRLIGVACEQAEVDCAATPPRLTLVSTDFGVRSAVVERVIDDLEAVGVSVGAIQVASSDIGDRIAAGNWDVAVLSLTEPVGASATATWLFNALDPESGRDVYRYGGADSIAAAERSAFQIRLFAGQFGAAADADRVLRLLGEVHQLLADEVVFVPIVASPRHTLVGEGIEGVVANASPSDVTWNIGQWTPAE